MLNKYLNTLNYVYIFCGIRIFKQLIISYLYLKSVIFF